MPRSTWKAANQQRPPIKSMDETSETLRNGTTLSDAVNWMEPDQNTDRASLHMQRPSERPVKRDFEISHHKDGSKSKSKCQQLALDARDGEHDSLPAGVVRSKSASRLTAWGLAKPIAQPTSVPRHHLELLWRIPTPQSALSHPNEPFSLTGCT